MRRRVGRTAVLTAVAVLVSLLLGSPSAARPPAPAAVAYRPPVTGAVVVVRGFDDVGRYDPGHRGVDLQVTAPGQVLAAGPGVVTFAGQVAGRGVVTVQHPDGVRTSYEPVTPAVTEGTTVAAGDLLGTVHGVHGGSAPDAVLHWGARVGDRYVDPLSLLTPLGPVRLLPWGGDP